MNKRWPFLTTVLCSSLIFSACSSSNATEDTPEREAINVGVATATNESLDAISSLSGIFYRPKRSR